MAEIFGNTTTTPIKPNLLGGGTDVDLTDYVKNTDYATDSKAGIVKINKYNGLFMAGASLDTLAIEKASNSEIDAKSSSYKPIVPSNLEYAVKSVTYGKAEIDSMVGDIETALDTIIAMQENLIGGDSV